jgi:hypothetical protein
LGLSDRLGRGKRRMGGFWFRRGEIGREGQKKEGKCTVFGAIYKCLRGKDLNGKALKNVLFWVSFPRMHFANKQIK